MNQNLQLLSVSLQLCVTIFSVLITGAHTVVEPGKLIRLLKVEVDPATKTKVEIENCKINDNKGSTVYS